MKQTLENWDLGREKKEIWQKKLKILIAGNHHYLNIYLLPWRAYTYRLAQTFMSLQKFKLLIDSLRFAHIANVYGGSNLNFRQGVQTPFLSR